MTNKVSIAKQMSEDLNRSLSAIDPTQGIHNKEKIKDITIKQLNRGYTVIVGCSKFAFSDAEEMLNLLTEYVLNPEETVSKYKKGELFK